MALRDDLLPLVDLGNELAAEFGLSRFAVTVRRRVWSGSKPGDGTATNNDLALTPPPRVRDAFTEKPLSPQELEYLSANGNVIQGHLYRIDWIPPAYVKADGSQGGYSAEQLRMWPNRDARHIEEVVVLVGDDGLARECVQISVEQDEAFGYAMLVKEQDRPRVQLQSIAVMPAPASVLVAGNIQMVATGTFNGGSTSRLTSLVAWVSSNPTVATVDLLGVATGIAPGTTNLTASLLGITSPLVTLTVS